jgi:hypothetical protein
MFFHPAAPFTTCSNCILVAAFVLLHGATVSAQPPDEEATTKRKAPATEQLMYRGIGGNILEAVPMEAEDRLRLQRLNAVLSSPISARSLAVALGIASPPLMLVGLVWGLWSAANIRPTQSGVQAVARRDGKVEQPDGSAIPRGEDLQSAVGSTASAALHRSLPGGVASPQVSALTSPPTAPLIRADASGALVFDGAPKVSGESLAATVAGAPPGQGSPPCEGCYMPMLLSAPHFPTR